MRSVTISWDRPTLLKALPVAVVASFAAVISYGHIETLALAHHQSIANARMLPFAVDFLIVAGTVFVLNGFGLGWLCVGLGVAGTLFANIESGVPYGWLAGTIASWPAVAFTAASFVLERWLRRQALNRAGQDAVAEVVTDPVPEPVPAAQPEVVAEKPAARPEPVQAPEPELAPLPVPAPVLAEVPSLRETPEQPTAMAQDVVNHWSGRGELEKLWSIVEDNSERALQARFGLRTRNQGVRLKKLREAAQEPTPITVG